MARGRSRSRRSGGANAKWRAHMRTSSYPRAKPRSGRVTSGSAAAVRLVGRDFSNHLGRSSVSRHTIIV